MDFNMLLDSVGLFGLSCLPLWLLGSFLAFCLGWLLDWLLNRGKQTIIDNLTEERDRYHGQATKWEKDYHSLKYQYEESQKSEADLRTALQRCEADKAILTNAANKDHGGSTTVAGIANLSGDGGGGSGYTGLFDDDNLQIIEGVGPKIESLLKGAGFTNWASVAAASAADLKKVMDDAGSRYKLADPTGWPHQAKLASEGNWDELIRYQKFTDGGRETTGDFETDSKFEKLAAKKMGFSSTNPNDLKVVEGVGPKIEGLMKDAGINNWSELAATTAGRLQEILNAAGSRYRLADPGTWPEQASLAAAGKWEALRALQDSLRGGK